MAGSKGPSALPKANELTGTEIIHVVQGGNSRYTTLADVVADLGGIGGGGGPPPPPSDTVPDQFTFVDVIGVPENTVIKSAPVVMTGLGATTSISIVNGEYEVNDNKIWHNTAATISPNQSVRVRHTSANVEEAQVNTTLIVGGVSDTFTSTTLSTPFTITTPEINALGAVLGDKIPAWSINFINPAPIGADAGDTIQIRYGLSNAAMLAAAPVSEVLDEGELINGDALFPEFDAWAALQAEGQTLYWQVRVIRGADESDWSTPATFVLADGVPNALNFVDVINAPLNTLTWSAPLLIAGLAVGAFTRISINNGALLRKNGAGGPTGSELTFQNGDTVEAGIQSAAINSINVPADIFVRGVLADTFHVTTVGGVFHPAQLYSSAGPVQGYAWDTTDLGKIWQTITGTTAAAFGAVVGRLEDISGNLFHFNAASNGASRPTLVNENNGLLSFDGVDDRLHQSVGAMLIESIGSTVIMAVKGAAQIDKVFFSENYGSSTSPRYYFQTDKTDGDDTHVLIRSQSNIPLDAPLESNVFNNTLKIVAFVNDGDDVKTFVNGLLIGSQAFDRTSVSFNLANLATLGSGRSSGIAAQFFTGRIGSGIAICRALAGAGGANATGELHDAIQWVADKHGVAI